MTDEIRAQAKKNKHFFFEKRGQGRTKIDIPEDFLMEYRGFSNEQLEIEVGKIKSSNRRLERHIDTLKEESLDYERAINDTMDLPKYLFSLKSSLNERVAIMSDNPLKESIKEAEKSIKSLNNQSLINIRKMLDQANNAFQPSDMDAMLNQKRHMFEKKLEIQKNRDQIESDCLGLIKCINDSYANRKTVADLIHEVRRLTVELNDATIRCNQHEREYSTKLQQELEHMHILEKIQEYQNYEMLSNDLRESISELNIKRNHLLNTKNQLMNEIKREQFQSLIASMDIPEDFITSTSNCEKLKDTLNKINKEIQEKEQLLISTKENFIEALKSLRNSIHLRQEEREGILNRVKIST